jgi:hypothetical protein
MGESGAANKSISAEIRELFGDAQKNGAFDYTLSLLRVGGIESGRDALLQLQDATSQPAASLDEQELLTWYCPIASLNDPLALVLNLLRCTQKQPYLPFPFTSLNRGSFPRIQHATQREKVGHVAHLARDAGRPGVAAILSEVYHDEALAACEAHDHKMAFDNLEQTCEAAYEFWKSLASEYFAARLGFRGMPRFHKWPQFEVLELLIDDHDGLYGYHVHFSNGSKASFARYSDHTEGVNVIPRDFVNYMAGDLDALKPEWHVGDKWLYEIGLPGRYNPLGQWKPIIYEGSTDTIAKRARELSDNPQVRGVLFYMMCTGHRVIEFVVKTTVDLPIDKPVTFGSVVHPIHLSKCPEAESEYRNVRLYDGWVRLESGTVEEVEAALFRIAVALNRLAFAFGVALDWQLKYQDAIEHTGMGLAQPSADDLPFLDRLLVDIPYELDFAVDWYNRGRSSNNPFAAFLCYFIALEIVATAAFESDSDFGVQVFDESKAVRRAIRAQCINDKYTALFASDPTQFIIQAYFECVQTLDMRRRKIAESVFGSRHRYLTTLFEEEGGQPSLTEIRNLIAHGKLSLVNREEAALVRRHLPRIAGVVKEFLVRLILRLQPADNVPDWSGKHSIRFSFGDPRNTQVASSDKMFPHNDWSIRPEWCE